MKIIYETERIILRVFKQEDLNQTKEFWGNQEVMEQCLGAIPHDKLPKVIEAYINCYREKGLSVYAVVEKDSGKVIGAAGFNVTDTLEKVELLYHFSKSAWGKGYATEAALACLNVAKGNNKVNIIYASADPNNANSIKILEKIGFVYQGMKWFEDTKQEEPYFELEK